MKRTNLILIILVPLLGLAQTNEFEYVQHDTINSKDSVYMALHGEITSLSASELSITVVPEEITKPDEWDIYYCILPFVCLPLEFAPSYTFMLTPSGSAQFSLDVQTYGVAGNGEWKIFVVDSSSMEIDSAFITIEYLTLDVDESVSVPDHFRISSIYPNPVNAQVNIKLSIEETGIYSMKLVSLTGRTVMEREYSLSPGSNHFSWNISSLTSGNYILSVEHANQIHTRKVIIIK